MGGPAGAGTSMVTATWPPGLYRSSLTVGLPSHSVPLIKNRTGHQPGDIVGGLIFTKNAPPLVSVGRYQQRPCVGCAISAITCVLSGAGTPPMFTVPVTINGNDGGAPPAERAGQEPVSSTTFTGTGVASASGVDGAKSTLRFTGNVDPAANAATSKLGVASTSLTKYRGGSHVLPPGGDMPMA